jgi:hypothetical protein
MLSNSTGNGVNFGFSLQGMAPIASGGLNSELLIGDPSYGAGDGQVYFYQATAAGLTPTPGQTLVGAYPNGWFGYNLASLGDVNGDQQGPDIAISAPHASGGYVYVFYIGSVSGQVGFVGGSSISATDYWTHGTPLPVNGSFANGIVQPQILHAPNAATTAGFGYGIAAAQDFNADGYADLVVNVPLGDNSVTQTISQTGYYLLYFGGPNGIQASNVPSPTPSCYGGPSPTCDPWVIYLPDAIAYENTYLSHSASGHINGDAFPDLVLGAFGRNHPSGQAFSVGIVYVVY